MGPRVRQMATVPNALHPRIDGACAVANGNTPLTEDYFVTRAYGSPLGDFTHARDG